MSDKEQIDALTGGNKESGTPAETIDWKARCEAAEKELQTQRVENGRLKKTSDMLAATQRELDELKASRRREDLASALDDNEREAIPNDILGATTKIVERGMGQLRDEQERFRREEEARRQQEMARQQEEERRQQETRQTGFINQLESRFPGFLGSISVGGDKAAAWKEYLAHNKASVSQAFTDCDLATMAYHVEMFYRNHLEIPVPSGSQEASAVPDPGTIGGGSTGQGPTSKKQYTMDEIVALYDQIETARARGDYAEIRRLEAEISSAQKEGRVK